MFTKLPSWSTGLGLIAILFWGYITQMSYHKHNEKTAQLEALWAGEPQPARSLLDLDQLDSLLQQNKEGAISTEEVHKAIQQLHAASYASMKDISLMSGLRKINGRQLAAADTATLTDAEINAIQMEQLEMASRISVFFSAIFFMLLAFYIIWSQNEGDLAVVKRSSLRKRLDYTITVNLYICFFSCLFNTVQLGDEDDFKIGNINHTLDLGRPIEWIMTCPLMQLCIPVLGGDKVPDGRTTSMPVVSLIILICGTISALVESFVTKILMYIVGAMFFLALCYLMNECIRDASGNGESLMRGSSHLRTLAIIVVLTWIPFPVWYALSPEGFNIITNSPAMKVAVAFLNVISKGTFTMYLLRVRDDTRLREKVVSEATGIHSMRNGAEGPVDQKFGLATSFVVMIQETLSTIGRSRDFDDIMRILDSNMITTPDDLLVLTQTYCEEVNLPWAFVFSFKDRWRRMKVNNADAWQLNERKPEMTTSPRGGKGWEDNWGPVSPAAPHVAKNPEKLQTVLRRMSSEGAPDGNFDAMKSPRDDDALSGFSKGGEMAMVQRGDGDVAAVVRDAEERLLARLDDMVNAKVMDVLHKNLKQQRER